LQDSVILNKIRFFAVCTLAEQNSAPQFFFFGNDAPLCIVFFSLLHQEKRGKNGTSNAI
jgi:hypothetical protein